MPEYHGYLQTSRKTSCQIYVETITLSTVADQGFPKRGRQPLYLGQKPIIWQDFCRKLHENERNWTERSRNHESPESNYADL